MNRQKTSTTYPSYRALLLFARVSVKAIGGSQALWWIVALRNYFQVNPSEIHQIPYNATHFGARKNGFNFTNITNGSFGKMTHLVYMDLSWNSLKTIGGSAFAGFNYPSLPLSHIIVK